jgi:hypothetical protein
MSAPAEEADDQHGEFDELVGRSADLLSPSTDTGRPGGKLPPGLEPPDAGQVTRGG